MFHDLEIAKKALKMVGQARAELNASIVEVSKSCREDELSGYKLAVGASMFTIFEEIIFPIYGAHPELIPEEDREWVLQRRATLQQRRGHAEPQDGLEG